MAKWRASLNRTKLRNLQVGDGREIQMPLRLPMEGLPNQRGLEALQDVPQVDRALQVAMAQRRCTLGSVSARVLHVYCYSR